MGRKVDVRGGVRVENILYSITFEKVPLHELAIQEFPRGIVFEFTPKPSVNRDAKPHLGSEHDFIREDATESLLQDVLLVIQTFELERERDLSRKFEEFMVEKWRASFESY